MKTIDTIADRVRTMLYSQLEEYERQITEAGTAPDFIKEISDALPDRYKDTSDRRLALRVAVGNLCEYLVIDPHEELREYMQAEIQHGKEWAEFIEGFELEFPGRTPQQVLCAAENASTGDALSNLRLLMDLKK